MWFALYQAKYTHQECSAHVQFLTSWTVNNSLIIFHYTARQSKAHRWIGIKASVSHLVISHFWSLVDNWFQESRGFSAWSISPAQYGLPQSLNISFPPYMKDRLTSSHWNTKRELNSWGQGDRELFPDSAALGLDGALCRREEKMSPDLLVDVQYYLADLFFGLVVKHTQAEKQFPGSHGSSYIHQELTMEALNCFWLGVQRTERCTQRWLLLFIADGEVVFEKLWGGYNFRSLHFCWCLRTKLTAWQEVDRKRVWNCIIKVPVLLDVLNSYSLSAIVHRESSDWHWKVSRGRTMSQSLILSRGYLAFGVWQ